jgi:hypothetical protein
VIQADLFQGDAREIPGPRLAKQLANVAFVMVDGQERTLRTIAALAGCETQSASARLRELRNKHGWTILRDRREGLVFYKGIAP